MVTLSMFIGLPGSILLGTVSLTGVSVSGMATMLTMKYQRKLLEVTKLVNIITSPLAAFKTSVSKVLNVGRVDEWEFGMLQMIHLEALNELAKIDCKMEAETRAHSQNLILEESTMSRRL